MILVDTHALIWLRTGDDRLGIAARRTLNDALRDGDLAVSAMTFWEVAMLKAKDRLEFPEDVRLWRREMLGQGLEEIPVDGGIAARAGMLENLHGDPADRIIVATALEGHRLVTADSRILDWGGNLDRLDARL